MSHIDLTIDSDRVVAELNELSQFSECPEPSPAVTRIVFSEQDLQARDYLKQLYVQAGLEVRVDAVGNTFARWVGDDPTLPVVGTGSHTDAIPFSGMYDGTVGVLGGLEAIRSLQLAGFRPRRSIELLMITSEEPTRFGIGCTGSRVMAGLLDSDDLDALTDECGDSYNTVRRRAGFSGDVAEAVIPDDYYQAWVELHIEQGPELERKQLPIGVVTAIAAPATLVVEVVGEGGHAGAVLMPGRRDALCATAEMISLVEHLAQHAPSDDLVATIGELHVHPGAVNSIPSRVRFTIDLRDIDLTSRDDVMQRIESGLDEIGRRRDVQVITTTLNVDPPAIASPMIVDAAARACKSAGLTYQKMVSRAYHDSLFIAQVAPIAMIFIPCRGGVSHRPDEYCTPEQITD
ncbi:MAG: M20 family metallo-hydrolase, partial [Planctomycetota bacterium]